MPQQVWGLAMDGGHQPGLAPEVSPGLWSRLSKLSQNQGLRETRERKKERGSGPWGLDQGSGGHLAPRDCLQSRGGHSRGHCSWHQSYCKKQLSTVGLLRRGKEWTKQHKAGESWHESWATVYLICGFFFFFLLNLRKLGTLRVGGENSSDPPKLSRQGISSIPRDLMQILHIYNLILPKMWSLSFIILPFNMFA